jgi:hypothetical protein
MEIQQKTIQSSSPSRVWSRLRHLSLFDDAAYLHALQSKMTERCGGSSCTVRKHRETSPSPTQFWSRPRHLPHEDDGAIFKQPPVTTTRVWSRPRHVPLEAFVQDLQTKMNESSDSQQMSPESVSTTVRCMPNFLSHHAPVDSNKLAIPMSGAWKISAMTFLVYVAELFTLYTAIRFFEITALSS